MINVYGWPQGTPDLWKSQNTLWKEMFVHVAGLGDVPWVMAGDWNATPDQLWMPALAPRTCGWFPDVGGRRPTCFPAKGEPTEKDFLLVSHCLRGAAADYDLLPVGALSTHRTRSLRRGPQEPKQCGMPGPRQWRTGSWNRLVSPRGKRGPAALKGPKYWARH